MIHDHIQYRLLTILPADGTAISYSVIKSLCTPFVVDEKVIKEAIIQLTADKFLKTSLKGFAITEDGRRAMENYEQPERVLEENIVIEEEENVSEASGIHYPAQSIKQEVIHSNEAEELKAKYIIQKRHRIIERIVALVLIAGAFAFGYYFGGIRPANTINAIQQENQILKEASETFKLQRYSDSITLDSIHKTNKVVDTMLLFKTDSPDN